MDTDQERNQSEPLLKIAVTLPIGLHPRLGPCKFAASIRTNPQVPICSPGVHQGPPQVPGRAASFWQECHMSDEIIDYYDY